MAPKFAAWLLWMPPLGLLGAHWLCLRQDIRMFFARLKFAGITAAAVAVIAQRYQWIETCNTYCGYENTGNDGYYGGYYDGYHHYYNWNDCLNCLIPMSIVYCIAGYFALIILKLWFFDAMRINYLSEVLEASKKNNLKRVPCTAFDATSLTVGWVGGWLGFHHGYLGNYFRALLYFCTGGVVGFFMLPVDLARMHELVKEANKDLDATKWPKPNKLGEAYMLHFMDWKMGLPHFYIESFHPRSSPYPRYWGLLELFTLRLFGMLGLGDCVVLRERVRLSNELEKPKDEQFVAPQQLIQWSAGFYSPNNSFVPLQPGGVAGSMANPYMVYPNGVNPFGAGVPGQNIPPVGSLPGGPTGPPRFDPATSNIRCADLSPAINSNFRITVVAVTPTGQKCAVPGIRAIITGASEAEASSRIIQVPTEKGDGIVEVSIPKVGRHNITVVDTSSNYPIGRCMVDVIEPKERVWRIATDGADIKEATRGDLPPIFGVGTMPLVSLQQAVQRLTNLVPEVSEQAEFATRFYASGSEPIPHGLHPEVAAAVRLYTMEYATREFSLYFMLNAALRSADRTTVQPYFSYMRLLLEAFEKMPKWDRTKSLWRGMNGDFRPAFKVGTTIPWWGYMSTTRDIDAAQRFLGTGERTLFNINGVEHGIPVEQFSSFKGEAEVLLPPGLELEVMSMGDMGGGLYMIQLTVNPNKQRLVT